MKQRFRMFRRGNYFWSHDGQTGKQETLHTKDKATGRRLLHAKNEAHQQPVFNLQIARTYLAASDPEIVKRTWQTAMNEIVRTKRDATRVRWERAIKDHAFDLIRNLSILETRSEHFLKVLDEGTVSTNAFLRKLHNFTLDMNWLPWPVLAKRHWPKIEYGEKRGVTGEEHQKIIAAETNGERRAFYELCWHLGAAQTAILFIGYALSPIFIGMLAFPSLQNVGRNYLLNLLGIMIWPLGWGVAGLITQGMIDFMTDQSFLSASSAPNTLYSLQNLMGLAFLGIWIIFSTIAAPIAIQRAITTGQSAASSLFSGAFSAGRAAATAGATTFAGNATTGIKTAIAAAAATEALVNSSMGENASVISSLAQMNSRNSGQERDQPKEKQSEGSFPSNDPTGDKTVSDLLNKSRDP